MNNITPLQFQGIVSYSQRVVPIKQTIWQSIKDWITQTKQLPLYEYTLTLRLDPLPSVGDTVLVQYEVRTLGNTIKRWEMLMRVVDRQHIAVKLISVHATPDKYDFTILKAAKYAIVASSFRESYRRGARG